MEKIAVPRESVKDISGDRRIRVRDTSHAGFLTDELGVGVGGDSLLRERGIFSELLTRQVLPYGSFYLLIDMVSMTGLQVA